MYPFMIGTTELKKLLRERRLLIVDLRPAISFRKGHIPTAVSFPYQEGMTVSGLFRKYEGVVFYCERGITSTRLVLDLRKRNFRAFSLIGGYKAYLRS